MKSLILAALFLFSCSPDEVNPNQQGCLSGLTNNGERYAITCCTKNQFEIARKDTKQGINNMYGIFTFFEDVQWKLCEECK